jgi:type IV pilus assembly protein PilW
MSFSSTNPTIPTLRTSLRGFTLVELMVAVTISLIILAAVAQIFTTSRATYGLEENLARVQENGRFAMEFLARDVRTAGFAGCMNVNKALNASDLNPNPDFTVTNDLQNPGNFERRFGPGLQIEGYEYLPATQTWSPGLPIAGVKNGSDVIVIRRASEDSARLENKMTSVTDVVDLPASVPATLGLAQNDIVLIADCSNVDLFQLSADPDSNDALSHASPPNQSTSLFKQYDTDAQVFKLIGRVYYVGTTTRGVPALMMREFDGTDPSGVGAAQELVENVEAMQIVYGVDSDNDGSANQYYTANAVPAGQWPRVVSVRIGLLVRTPDENGLEVDNKTYHLLDGTGTTDAVSPNNNEHDADKRQRRIFTTTMQLRNQI